MKRFFSNAVREESGGVLILIGVSLTVLIASMAVAVDMGRVFLAYSKAQTALDSAVLAASSVAGDDDGALERMQTRADAFYKANFPGGYLDTTSGSVQLGFNADEGRVSGDVRINQKTAFGQFVGLTNVPMSLSSDVTRVGNTELEIALVLDHTGSMGAVNGDFNPQASQKIVALNLAVETLVTTITNAANATNPESIVYWSYIPFNHDVRVNGELQYSREEESGNLPNSLGLRPDTQPILNSITNLRNTLQDAGGTNTAHGTLWGWRSLSGDANSKALFTLPPGSSRPIRHPSPDEDPTHNHPVDIANPDVNKIMIILTDGANQFVVRGTKEYNVRPDDAADAKQRQLCPLIKDEGIELYTVVVEDCTAPLPNNSKIKTIFRECASDPKPSHFFTVCFGGLEQAFQKIANSIVSLRITK